MPPQIHIGAICSWSRSWVCHNGSPHICFKLYSYCLHYGASPRIVLMVLQLPNQLASPKGWASIEFAMLFEIEWYWFEYQQCIWDSCSAPIHSEDQWWSPLDDEWLTSSCGFDVSLGSWCVGVGCGMAVDGARWWSGERFMLKDRGEGWTRVGSLKWKVHAE